MGIIYKNSIPYGGGGGGECEEYSLGWDEQNKSLTLSDGSATVQTQELTGVAMETDLATKQDTLVSGTNIKTVNGQSLLGSGDLTVGGGSTENRYVGITRIPLETSSSLCTLHCQTKDGTNLEANAGTLYVDGYDRDYLYVSGGISYSGFTGSGEITDISVIGCDYSKFFRVITDLDTDNFEIKQEPEFGFGPWFVGSGDLMADRTPRYPFMLHLCVDRDLASQTYKYALRASGGLFIPAALNSSRGPLFINAYFKIPRYLIDYKQAEF